MQDIVCTVEPYTSHDLACKNAKFTGIPGSCPLSLPVTPRWEGVVRLVEAKRHTYRAFKLKVVAAVFASKPPIPWTCISLRTYNYIMYIIHSPNYLRRSIFCCSWHCWILMISRLGIVFKNERRQVNVKIRMGI